MTNCFQYLLFYSFMSILFVSCDSNEDEQVETDLPEPKLIDNYYFKGDLDGDALDMEIKFYDISSEDNQNLLSLDFGGSQTSDIEVLGEPGTGFCYGNYACGLVQYDGILYDETLDTAKLYFWDLPVGECALENELAVMKEFLENKTPAYRVFGNGTKSSFSFEFFPKETSENQECYYSSRFGDNTDATITISSVEEVDKGVYIVEGRFSCKLYKLNDSAVFKQLEGGQFRVKISNNLKE
ncbi:hypothetical protein ABW636_01620 [Aquimarina sp. 2201CG1-2-11]